MATTTTTTLLLLLIISTLTTLTQSSVIPPYGDFCVGVPGQTGTCKDPKAVTVNDFYTQGAEKVGDTNNPMGVKVTPFNSNNIPGLNGLGMQMVRVDIAVGGINTLHTHPRASEIVTVLEGQMEVGFVSSMPDMRHFMKTLNKGDVFVIPFGLIHYQKNTGNTPAVAICFMNSANAGMIPLYNSLFQTNLEPICPDIIAKAFNMDVEVVKKLQQKKP